MIDLLKKPSFCAKKYNKNIIIIIQCLEVIDANNINTQQAQTKHQENLLTKNPQQCHLIFL